MSDQIKSQEEIDALKTSWKHDPAWDIEDTQGFEAYYEELKAWREEYELECERISQERKEARAALVREQTGVADADIVSSLHTWKEIERDVYDCERTTDDPLVSIKASLVRATLLQAAQLKRIADALELMEDGDSLSNSVKIWGSGG